jgi:hypothetical protein
MFHDAPDRLYHKLQYRTKQAIRKLLELIKTSPAFLPGLLRVLEVVLGFVERFCL